MNIIAVTMVSVLGVISCILCLFGCKNFIREYEKIMELMEPVSNVRRNQIYPLPVANGIEVVVIDEGIEVINIIDVIQ